MSSEQCAASWINPAVFTAALLSLVILYVLGWYRLRKDLPTAIAMRCFVAFIFGILAVELVWATPLADLDHHSLTAHMVQHLVLMTIAAPLILLGSPVVILRQSLLRGSTGIPGQFIVFDAIRTRLRLLTHPVACWFAGTACIICWHIPGCFQLGLRSEFWHEFEKATFLVGGLLFWWPVARQGRNDKGRIHCSMALYLFLATLPCDALSAFLTFCGRVVYATYASGAGSTEMSALRDQEFAGSMMWVWVTFVYLVAAVMISFRMLSDEPRSARAGTYKNKNSEVIELGA